jgi:hypothetical protein
MPKTSSVAKKEQTALAQGAVSFEEDAGGGFEEADKDSFAIPYEGILQQLSPQLDETKGEFIEGAKAGMFHNSVTDEVCDGKEGIFVIPCHYRRVFVEWNKREDGGGFIAEYSAADGALIETTLDDRKRDITADNTQLVDTRCHFVSIVGANGMLQNVVITMKATQAKKSKRWMTLMQNLLKERSDGTLYNPAMFASIFKLTTVPESNEQGSWHSWKITHDHFLDEKNAIDQRMYQTARAFRDAIKSGEAVVKHDANDDMDSDGTDSAKSSAQGTDSIHDDIPGF